jgi:hypothetical protein
VGTPGIQMVAPVLGKRPKKKSRLWGCWRPSAVANGSEVQAGDGSREAMPGWFGPRAVRQSSAGAFAGCFYLSLPVYPASGEVTTVSSAAALSEVWPRFLVSAAPDGLSFSGPRG